MTIFGLMEPLQRGTFLLKTCQGNFWVCFMESSIEQLCSFSLQRANFDFAVLHPAQFWQHCYLYGIALSPAWRPRTFSNHFPIPHTQHTLSSSCCPFLMAGKREEIELLSIWICEQEFVVATNAHPSTRMCNSSSAHHTNFGSLLLWLSMVNWIYSKLLTVFVTTWLQYVLIPFWVFRYFRGFSENVISKSFEISSQRPKGLPARSQGWRAPRLVVVTYFNTETIVNCKMLPLWT